MKKQSFLHSKWKKLRDNSREASLYMYIYIYIHKDGASSSHIQDGQTTSRHLDHTYCATYTALLLTVILARYSKHLVLYMKILGDI